MATVGGSVPSAMVDIVDRSVDGTEFVFGDKVDLSAALKAHKKTILFAVPGAFTPTCSEKHLPGFIAKADELYAKGVDAIYCLSVNDRFVMRAWAKATAGSLESKIKFVADGNGDFARASGLEKDASAFNMGLRSKRFALIVEDGVITHLKIDEKALEETSAESMLNLLA